MGDYKRFALVFILFFVFIYFLQFTSPRIIEYDGYSNIKLAELTKQKGIIKEFPWATHTILSKNYADLSHLFRFLQLPFTFFDLTFAAKISSVFFSALCFLIFYWYLYKKNIKYAFAWTFIYLIASKELIYRFLLPRQMPLVVSLIILTIFFLENKKYFSLSIVSLLSVWLYSGFIIQFFICIIYFLMGFLTRKNKEYKIIIYAFFGVVLGIIINPYFPNNLTMLWLQWTKVNLLNLYNYEWRAWPLKEFISNNYVVIIIFIAGFVGSIKTKLEKNKLLFCLLSFFFLIYTIKSKRMQEYFVPFAIMFSAFSLNDILSKKTASLRRIKTLALIIMIIVAFSNYAGAKDRILKGDFLFKLDNGINWMKLNIPKGSLVFNNAYTFNYLFFKNSDLHYTHGIDLAYSYLYNKEEFGRYILMLKGELTLDYNIIKADYAPDYVFFGKLVQDEQLLLYIGKYINDYELVYEDDHSAILKLKK